MLNLGTTPLRALRQWRGMTSAQFTRRTKLSPTTQGFLERGAAPTPDQLIALARGLDLDPGVLAVALATGTLEAVPGADANVSR